MKTKRERFETVAAKRVQRIIGDLDSLAKCANKNNYEFSEEDVQKMMAAIKRKLRNVEELFSHNIGNGKGEFRF